MPFSERQLPSRRCLYGAAFAFSLAVCGCSSLSKPKIIPDSIAACRELAQRGASAMEMGDSVEAERLLAGAVESEPTDVEARRHLAEAMWANGDRSEAVLHMETAMQLAPGHPGTVVRVGEMQLALGQTRGAEQRAEEALALAPTMPEAWALRGRVFRELGEPKRSLADLQQSLAYAPHNKSVLQDVASLQFELKRPRRCLSTLHSLLDGYPHGEEPRDALWLEGLAYGALDRHSDAAKSLAEATQRGNPPAELLYHLAMASNQCGDAAQAADAAERALATDASHGPSQVLLASLRADGTRGNAVRTASGTILR
ncbi:MAG: tetratricopeptide repeat protein [Planctomycetota bacterium]